jgi:uncharacterized protein YukE
MAKTHRVRQSHSITPPEAGQIAAALRQYAREIRTYSGSLKASKTLLENSWEGRSREQFLEMFSVEPGKLENLAAMLEEKASEISRLTVTVWEWVEVPDTP